MSRRIQLLFFVAGLVFFTYLVIHTGAHEILANLRTAGWVLVPIALVWAVVYVINTWTWRLLMVDEATRIPFGHAFVITVSGFSINYITPMVSLGGEPFKIAASSVWLGKRGATSAAVLFRMFHTFGQFLFWLTGVPVAFLLLPRSGLTTELLALVSLGLAAFTAFLFSLLRRGMLERALDLVHRLPLLRGLARLVEPHRAELIAIDEQIIAFSHHHPGHFVTALLLEFTGRLVAMFEFLLIGRSVGLPIRYPTAFLIGSFSQLALNLLFFVPFEMGSKEGGIYVIFKLLGLPTSLAVYTSIVSRMRELTWIAIGLLLIWLSGGRGRRAVRGQEVRGTREPGVDTAQSLGRRADQRQR
jgi:uncharacterized protein (TIRG00374 family)